MFVLILLTIGLNYALDKKSNHALGGLALTCSIAFQASATENLGHYNIYHHRDMAKTWLEMLQKSHP